MTVYAKANEKAELDTLALADNKFCVTVMRQATVFGYSPRMRFDLAINGMTYGAFSNGVLPLMRDGERYRPMIHVQDTTDVIYRLLEIESEKVNGELSNFGSDENYFQFGQLGRKVARCV